MKKKPTNDQVRALILRAARACFTPHSWTHTFHRSAFKERADRYLQPFRVLDGDHEVCREIGAYNTPHERCMWLCFAAATVPKTRTRNPEGVERN